MNELFLHYVWKYQQFRYQGLTTTDDRPLLIVETGHHNHDSGPDFMDAKIRHDGLLWIGKIEIHVLASDWYAHGHQLDRNYENVILHVVWENDREILLQNGETIPTLELKGRVSDELLIKSRQLTNSPADIPCIESKQLIPDLQRINMVSKTLVERMEKKATECFQLLDKTGNNWEETAFQILSRSFGAHLNQDNFQRLAQHVPLKIIRKQAGNDQQITSLFFGQAGFLDEESADPYQNELRDEYRFLAGKYGLNPVMSRFQWKFHRMRPSNFPTRRIAMLASFMSQCPRLFRMVIDEEIHPSELRKKVGTIGDYWHQHYDFGKRSGKSKIGAGAGFINGLIINAFVPLLVVASRYFDDSTKMDKAVRLLEGVTPENNKITRLMQSAGFSNQNAADSQGMIHLYRQYCSKKRCLGCNIGVFLLRSA